MDPNVLDWFVEETQRKASAFIHVEMKRVSDILEEQTRKNAIPPIKGEITPGKLKWRGLKYCIQKKHDGIMFNNFHYVTQRGKIITDKVLSF